MDSVTTYTILCNKKYFVHLLKVEEKVNTISGASIIIEGFGNVIIILPIRTKFNIHEVLYSLKSKCNLLSFKDIYLNNYYLKTLNNGIKEFLIITFTINGVKKPLEKLPYFLSRLYYTKINELKDIEMSMEDMIIDYHD